LAHIQNLRAELASTVLFYNEQGRRGEKEVTRLKNELAIEITKSSPLSYQTLIFRWKSGNIDYAQVVVHISIAERIVDAYTRLLPDILPPESRRVQLTAEEAYTGKCKTPSNTSSWSGEFGALAERNPIWYEKGSVHENNIYTNQDHIKLKRPKLRNLMIQLGGNLLESSKEHPQKLAKFSLI
jgi:hypothetical protein